MYIQFITEKGHPPMIEIVSLLVNTFANFDSHRLAKNDTQYIVCLKNRAHYILMLILKKCQKFHFGEGIDKWCGNVVFISSRSYASMQHSIFATMVLTKDKVPIRYMVRNSTRTTSGQSFSSPSASKRVSKPESIKHRCCTSSLHSRSMW